MLIQKQTVPYICVFKISSGEEIIARVVEDTISEYIVEKPLQMVMGQQGFQFAPFMMMVDSDKPIPLKKSAVIACAPPMRGIEGQYESITTGIALPQKSSIIT